MADIISQPKRPRDEEISLEQEENNPQELIKRQKTYNQLLSILEEDEEEPINDNLSNIIFTTLEQELSSSSSHFSLNFDNILLPNNFDVLEGDNNQELHATNNNACSSLEKSMCDNNNNQILKNEKELEDNDVMRHLLEASDDELGLPGTGGGAATGGVGVGGGGGDNIYLNDGLWEFEDESANYYAMLQSELFM